MKKTKLISLIVLIIAFSNSVQGQFVKKVAKKANNKIEREAERRTERRINKKIDEGYDKIEDKIDGKNKDKKQKESVKKTNSSESDPTTNQTINSGFSTKPNVSWSRYDFVPGDTVIFEDGASADEENGEFPSRWDLVKGQVEIAEQTVMVVKKLI